jgi:hypothetical protein
VGGRFIFGIRLYRIPSSSQQLSSEPTLLASVRRSSIHVFHSTAPASDAKRESGLWGVALITQRSWLRSGVVAWRGKWAANQAAISFHRAQDERQLGRRRDRKFTETITGPRRAWP